MAIVRTSHSCIPVIIVTTTFIITTINMIMVMVRMASRLPILLLLCLIPILASALGWYLINKTSQIRMTVCNYIYDPLLTQLVSSKISSILELPEILARQKKTNIDISKWA